MDFSFWLPLWRKDWIPCFRHPSHLKYRIAVIHSFGPSVPRLLRPVWPRCALRSGHGRRNSRMPWRRSRSLLLRSWCFDISLPQRVVWLRTVYGCPIKPNLDNFIIILTLASQGPSSFLIFHVFDRRIDLLHPLWRKLSPLQLKVRDFWILSWLFSSRLYPFGVSSYRLHISWISISSS